MPINLLWKPIGYPMWYFLRDMDQTVINAATSNDYINELKKINHDDAKFLLDKINQHGGIQVKIPD